MKYHPATALFPLIEGPEYEQLKADIAANGLREAIWLHPDGSIIDGRNRHRACIEAGKEPHFKTWYGEGSPVAFVVSMNLYRRHLTSSQCAMIATDALPMLEAEAKKRQGTRTDLLNFPETIPESEQGEARDQAATLFQTNPHYVQDAKNIAQKAPDLAEQIRAGKMTIPQAKRELTKRTKVEAPPLVGKYRIFYADPPWKYNDSGVIGSDNYGHVERHYPSMSIDELCAMGEQIKAVSEPNAVLFLWVTSPLLEECFAVVRAWGFEYKTSFVWDKIRHNFGHYNSVRHELLLVCTRGSCIFDNPELFDSVQSIEKSDKHSQKPKEFRDIIDTLYPNGARIELFARETIPGWENWGNELSL